MKTSYYANLKKIDTSKFEPVAISGYEGKMVGFEGRGFRKLSPYSFFRKWKEREVEIENAFKCCTVSQKTYETLKKENQNDYIQKFYNKVLKPLDPKQFIKIWAKMQCYCVSKNQLNFVTNFWSPAGLN